MWRRTRSPGTNGSSRPPQATPRRRKTRRPRKRRRRETPERLGSIRPAALGRLSETETDAEKHIRGPGVTSPGMASTAPSPADQTLDRIVLDIKLLGSQQGWGPASADRLRERLLASHDDHIKGFLSSLEPHRPMRPWGQLLVGAGELVLGAFLMIAGLVLVVPAILGFTSRVEIARYLSDLALGLSSSGLSDPLLVAIGFGFALFL